MAQQQKLNRCWIEAIARANGTNDFYGMAHRENNIRPHSQRIEHVKVKRSQPANTWLLNDDKRSIVIFRQNRLAQAFVKIVGAAGTKPVRWNLAWVIPG